VQGFGVVTGLLLLTQMGPIALGGAVLIVVASAVWYLAYVRPRVRREGVARDAIRRQVGRDALDDVASAAAEPAHEVLVALPKPLGGARERALVALAADLVRPDDGRVRVVRFEEIPDQAPLTETATTQSAADQAFESRVEALGDELGVAVEAGEVVSHDSKHAIVNVAESHDIETIVAEHEPLRLRSRLLGDPVDWVVRHAPCEVLLVDNVGYDAPRRVTLSGAGGPYDPLAVQVADRVAAANDGTVSLWYPDDGDATDRQRRTVDEYRTQLSELLTVPVDAEPFRTDGGGSGTPDLLVRRGPDHRLRTALFDQRPVVPTPGCTTVTVYPRPEGRPSLWRRLLERVVF
jgi:nucleotide-binding universal stress UspA family protein